MTKDWQFNQPLEEQGTASEEREKIAALFGKTGDKPAPVDNLDYLAAFEKRKQAPSPQPAPKKQVSKSLEQAQEVSSDITSDYKLYLSKQIAQNTDDVMLSQKKIEDLHSLIDQKNQQTKKLQAIYDAIDEL
ncbi:DUF5945 family protein [Streptococcus loxodontisalivarius]|uniref:Chemotaxis protein n=1 Tax=Streptococcus loxodontisalivarius TaxID=1349415 RepID=A0ABS2PPU8_9STRE|nr:DUF5945 family protein [Streptococcus loxodontisalivarius]MBM7642054.1 hypothetical protein [Streptococcus loxodontisalivarius]